MLPRLHAIVAGVDSILLVVDLEGVAGVDDVESLIAGSPGFARARRRLTDEVMAAVRGLAARGVRRIRVSDSHRAGVREPTVLAAELPDVEFRWEDDAYAPAMWDGMDAVACLGMHAAAGTQGFAAHTVSVQCAWQVGGRPLSETDIVLGLAAERGVPALFVTGDDVLGRTVTGPTYVETKRALDPARSESRGRTDVWRDIERAAAASPVSVPPLPGEIIVGFKSRWQAEVAGGERVGTHAVRVGGKRFGEAYRAALAATRRSDTHLGAALPSHSDAAAIEDATGMLLRPFPGDRSPSYRLESELALEFFLGATAGGRGWERADRALILHMLEGHAPRLFADLRLGPVLDDAMRALASLPCDFPLELHPVEAMARVDALYLAAERGADRAFDVNGLARYLRRIVTTEPLFAWLLDEMAAQLGRTRTLALPERALRAVSRAHDLYWLTHLYLLATRYLRRPLPRRGWETRTEELCLATPFVASGLRTDLGAEVALCLQLAGEEETGEHRRLLALLRDHQQPDGRVADPSTQGEAKGDEADRLRAHTTGAALLAFAGTVRE